MFNPSMHPGTHTYRSLGFTFRFKTNTGLLFLGRAIVSIRSSGNCPRQWVINKSRKGTGREFELHLHYGNDNVKRISRGNPFVFQTVACMCLFLYRNLNWKRNDDSRGLCLRGPAGLFEVQQEYGRALSSETEIEKPLTPAGLNPPLSFSVLIVRTTSRTCRACYPQCGCPSFPSLSKYYQEQHLHIPSQYTMLLFTQQETEKVSVGEAYQNGIGFFSC